MNLQKSIALVAITAMLLGNGAGWIHMGCVHLACEDHSGSLAAADLGSAEDGDGCQHTCCHHSTSTDDLHEDTSDSPDPASGEPHDSDRCSVCQNFYTARHAVHVAAPFVGSLLPAVAEWIPTRSLEAPSRIDLDGETVRGPPIV